MLRNGDWGQPRTSSGSRQCSVAMHVDVECRDGGAEVGVSECAGYVVCNITHERRVLRR